jgi:8-oxo-dGTP pyrophosphatase MutT (NUDIX family)
MMRSDVFLSELRAYVPFDDTELQHRERMLRLLADGDDAFTRAHFAPGHFTASCFVLDDSGRLLLHHHRRLNRWLQMGGHVEANEPLPRAALREAMEESGLHDLRLEPDAIFDLDIHGIPAAKGEPEHEHFDIRYVARTTAPEDIVIDRAESNALAWVTLERAAELMPGPESQRVILKLRERSEH